MIQNSWLSRFHGSRRGRVYFLWFLLLWLVVLAGPFTTYPLLPLDIRLAYWSIVLGLAMPVACVLPQLLRRIGQRLSRTVVTLVLPFVMATVYGAVIAGVTWGFARLGYPLNLPFWLIWCGVFLSTVAVQAGERLIQSPHAEAAALVPAQAAPLPAPLTPVPEPQATPELPAPPEAADPDPMPRLLQRLDPPQRAAVMSLSVSDHYVAVNTRRGEVRLLMRFADAVAEMDGIDGLQIHRSHWVAQTAVVTHERERGRSFLRLVDGRRLPVSRSYSERVSYRWPV